MIFLSNMIPLEWITPRRILDGMPNPVHINGTLPSFQCRWNYPIPDPDSREPFLDDLWYPPMKDSGAVTIPLNLNW
ncbi:MAG: hypothetical protein K6F85_05380 [Bacteroidales bacterium]|nr:hypothetical protein [Bacteroidales bacterium]